MEQERIARITFPTVSYSLPLPCIKWVAAQAKRKKVKKSHVVRDLIEAAMSAPVEQIANGNEESEQAA